MLLHIGATETPALRFKDENTQEGSYKRLLIQMKLEGRACQPFLQKFCTFHTNHILQNGALCCM